MRPVTVEHIVSQYFAAMATQGVIGNINASPDTTEYWVGRYGNYQPFGHAGMDFACPVGTRVHTMADGVVLYAGWGYNLPGSGPIRKWLFYKDFPGILTVIQHDGWISAYAHLSDNDMAPAGTVVHRGQLIALSGNTGGVDPHLHVEALVDLNYTTGSGLIYGRTDPSKFFGGLAAQGSITQEDDMASFTDDIIKDKDGGQTTPEKTYISLDEKVTRTEQKLDQVLSMLEFTAIDGSRVKLADQLVSLDRKAEQEKAENAAMRAALEEIRSRADVAPEVTAAIDKALGNLSITLTAGGK